MNNITVICPNSRRCMVKVTPTTQLRKILEEACLKQGFDVSTHQLKHQNHTLDLALPLRLTSLPNNATVEMIQSIGVGSGVPVHIDIALQLPDGSRFMQEFSNKANLLDVLHEFSKKSAQDLIKCSNGQIPCCAYMNKEYRGEAELGLTTLEAMGITGGRCLIRYFAVNMSPAEISNSKIVSPKKMSGRKTRKMENERRLQLQIEREEIFERQLKAKRETETARLLELSQEANRNFETTLHTAPISSENLNQDAVEHIAEPDRQPQASRLHQLQSLLNQVNTSLVTNTVDFLGEQLIGEDGRIHINEIQTNDQYNGNVCNSITSSSEASYSAVEKCNRMPVIIRHDSESSGRLTEAIRREEDIDDQFFELTVSDVNSIRRDLKAQIRMQEQRALLPKTYIAEKIST
ncbi:hypothetical protein DINM_003876 [Dirofilaria immitis]|nr:hypothetical protein [Dirofilaria immitis]